MQDVVRTFGAVRAVDGASFAVEEQSITGLIGPNGAGKSTLFATIAGSLKPDSGRILFAGARIDRRPAYRVARAGVVRTYQAARVLTRMTVLDNLLLASTHHPGERLTGLVLKPRAARAHEQRALEHAREVLALVRLESHTHEYAGTLSGGQRKLLDLARVLMLEPSLVLLDEPMAGVSPALRVELLEHILAVAPRPEDHVPDRRARPRLRHAGGRPRRRHERGPRARRRRAGRGADERAGRRRIPGEGALTTPLLEVGGLEAGYDDALILRGVSLVADAEQIVAIVGPNGAGKSTLLKAVYGLATSARRLGAFRRRRTSRASAPTG